MSRFDQLDDRVSKNPGFTAGQYERLIERNQVLDGEVRLLRIKVRWLVLSSIVPVS
jgi:hypothetical protein